MVGIASGEGRGKRERVLGRVGKSPLSISRFSLACEQALRVTLAAGQEKEEEFTTTYLELEFRLWFPWLPEDWAVRFLPISAKQKRAWMSISISHRLFRCRYSSARRACPPFPPFCACQATTPKSAWLHSDQGGNSPVVESSIFVLDLSRGYTTKLLGILSYINQPSGVFFWARDSSLRWSVPRSSLCT